MSPTEQLAEIAIGVIVAAAAIIVCAAVVFLVIAIINGVFAFVEHYKNTHPTHWFHFCEENDFSLKLGVPIGKACRICGKRQDDFKTQLHKQRWREVHCS